MQEKLLQLAGSKPAPGELLLVQAFVNTWDMNSEGGNDRIATPEKLRVWLIDVGLIDRETTVTQSDTEAVIRVREALRKLALANNGGAEDANALETLNRAARCAQLAVRFDTAGDSRLEPLARGVDGALGRILAATFHAMQDGTWLRFKACPADYCEFAFYDETKNRSGTWCAMQVCGNRTKARKYRHRHAAKTETSGV